ncbi:uncharacterized protein GJ701_017469 [Geothlypis trichas]
MLLPSKPLPPIQKSSPSTKPSPTCSGEQENGKNGSGWDEERRTKQELSSEGKGCKTSLLYSIGGDMKKGSLGPPLIPPIGRAVSPPVGSAAGSLPSSPQLEFQESQEMRPRPSSRSKENSEDADLTGYSLTEKFSPDTSHVPSPTKSSPPGQKSSLSSKIRKKLPPV